MHSAKSKFHVKYTEKNSDQSSTDKNKYQLHGKNIEIPLRVVYVA